MKIFKWYHILIFLLTIFAIAGLFFFLSFNIKADDIPRWSLFAALFFGLGSLSFSFVALWISIQTFVKTNKKEQEKLESEANAFIVEHSDEIQYLPLCLISSCFNRQGKYQRKIYTEFNLLNNNQQKEVLRQRNYDIDLIKDTKWVDKSLKRIKNFINEFELGRDLLYDNAKYYRRTFLYKEKQYDLNVEFAHLFRSDILGMPKYEIRNNGVYDKGISFFDYLRYYLVAKNSNDPRALVVPKPIDLLAETIDFGNIDESDLCLWMMCLVDSCAELMIEKLKEKQEIEDFPCCDGGIETYEDRFLQSLSILYELSKYKDEKQ